MKYNNQLLALVLTSIALLNAEPAHADIQQCQINNYSLNDQSAGILSCAGSPYYGGYITVKNISKDKTIVLIPNGGSTIQLNPNDESNLIYMVAGMQVTASAVMPSDVLITIKKQCTTQPTVAEIRNSTCQ